MDLQNAQIGFVGGGAMAENILRGILSAGIVPADHITVSEIHPQRRSYIQETFQVQTTQDNRGLAARADIIVLAVKPQNLKALLEEIAPAVNNQKLILSIAAGITTDAIARCLSAKGRIVRIMPNIAAKVLESASALCAGPAAGEADLGLACELFAATGKTVVITEGLMDAVTGLSGSGPAYIFLVIESLADAGVKAGLPRSTACTLAAQTCLGAAKLVLETEQSPAVLKDQVTSPAGTTIAGMQVLEKGAVRGTIMEAVEAAVARSRELGS